MQFYDKRKIAALEVEQMVRSMAIAHDRPAIEDLVDTLSNSYALSAKNNARKGGLLCLAASAVGLASAPDEAGLTLAADLMPRLVTPILASFTDPDPRVRYYALEALYNVAKSTRGPFLAVFSEVFDALFRVCADVDQSVQNAAAFLNNLVKDIVAEHEDFRLEGFFQQLGRCMDVDDPHKRQFLLGWVALLEGLPGRDLWPHLPELLPGMLAMLADPAPEIAQSASRVLADLETDHFAVVGEVSSTNNSAGTSSSSVMANSANSARGDEIERTDARIAGVMAFILTRVASGWLFGDVGLGTSTATSPFVVVSEAEATSARALHPKISSLVAAHDPDAVVPETALRWLHGLLARGRRRAKARAGGQHGDRASFPVPLQQECPAILEGVLLSLGSPYQTIVAVG